MTGADWVLLIVGALLGSQLWNISSKLGGIQKGLQVLERLVTDHETRLRSLETEKTS